MFIFKYKFYNTCCNQVIDVNKIYFYITICLFCFGFYIYRSTVVHLRILSYIYLLFLGASVGSISCSNCGKTYKHRSSLNNHRKYECGKKPQFLCNLCPYKTFRKGNYGRHLLTQHRINQINTM